MIAERNFAPCLKVILADRTTVMVPIDKASSDAQRSVLIAKAREFVEKQLTRLSSAGLTPAEVKDLVKAVGDMDALQREQYITTINDKADTSLGRGLQGVVRQVAQGMAEGTAAGFAKKMEAMDKAAKKAEEKAKAIEV